MNTAEEIIKKLKNLGAKIKSYDPYFTSKSVFGINVENNIENIISNVDAAIIVTAHSEFKKLELSLFTKMKTPILVDTRGIIEPHDAKQQKIIFRGLGRGDF